MKKIAIVTKTIHNYRPIPFGLDGLFSSFGVGGGLFIRSRSRKLIKELNKKLEENNLSYKVYLDNSSEDIKEIKEKGVDLILISPYIKHIISFNGVDESDYYILSEKEYMDGFADDIVRHVRHNL